MGVIVLMVGLPGVGKTAVARELAKRTQGYVLNRDDIRDAIFPPAQLDYSAEQNAVATSVMLMVAEYILSRHPDCVVILDGKPFAKRTDVNQVQELAKRLKQDMRVLHLVCPDEVARARLESDLQSDPRNVAADRTYEKYQKLKREFEALEVPHAVIDTARNIEDVVQDCLQYVLRPTGD